MAAAQNKPGQVDLPVVSLEALAARLDRVETALSGILSGKVAELSQEDKDRRTLASLPNSYHEAVEYEAAQKRQADRDGKSQKD